MPPRSGTRTTRQGPWRLPYPPAPSPMAMGEGEKRIWERDKPSPRPPGCRCAAALRWTPHHDSRRRGGPGTGAVPVSPAAWCRSSTVASHVSRLKRERSRPPTSPVLPDSPTARLPDQWCVPDYPNGTDSGGGVVYISNRRRGPESHPPADASTIGVGSPPAHGDWRRPGARSPSRVRQARRQPRREPGHLPSPRSEPRGPIQPRGFPFARRASSCPRPAKRRPPSGSGSRASRSGPRRFPHPPAPSPIAMGEGENVIRGRAKSSPAPPGGRGAAASRGTPTLVGGEQETCAGEGSALPYAPGVAAARQGGATTWDRAGIRS